MTPALPVVSDQAVSALIADTSVFEALRRYHWPLAGLKPLPPAYSGSLTAA